MRRTGIIVLHKSVTLWKRDYIRCMAKPLLLKMPKGIDLTDMQQVYRWVIEMRDKHRGRKGLRIKLVAMTGVNPATIKSWLDGKAKPIPGRLAPEQRAAAIAAAEESDHLDFQEHAVFAVRAQKGAINTMMRQLSRLTRLIESRWPIDGLNDTRALSEKELAIMLRFEGQRASIAGQLGFTTTQAAKLALEAWENEQQRVDDKYAASEFNEAAMEILRGEG